MNYYTIGCTCVTPLYRIVYNYRIVGAEHMRAAAQAGRVVVCTTHSSDLGGMIVGMAVSIVLKTEPWVVINIKFRRNLLVNFFLKDMNVIWIKGNDMPGNYPALRRMRDLLIEGDSRPIIIAPQGTHNRPDLKDLNLRQGFAIPCLQAARAGARVHVVPALDIGATYKSMPAPGRRIAVAFGKPIRVHAHDSRASLTGTVLDNLTILHNMHNMGSDLQTSNIVQTRREI
ncbi:hypothetical protein IBX73_06840 [candidate division WOR-3 bacterium]|nr:hypothetical protein [candidate division WOR-3 bacterium]